MTRKFNFYCILLLIAVAFSLSSAAVDFVKGFKQGLADANVMVQDQQRGCSYESYDLNLQSNNPARRELAMVNQATGQTDSLRISEVTAWIATDAQHEKSGWALLGECVVLLAMLGCFLVFWVVFVRLVLAVNRGDNFNASVVRSLRLMGWLILAIYAGEWLAHLFGMPPAVDYEGYTVTSSSIDCDNMLLVVGIGLQVVSQLFAVGQKMKEENDLTI